MSQWVARLGIGGVIAVLGLVLAFVLDLPGAILAYRALLDESSAVATIPAEIVPPSEIVEEPQQPDPGEIFEGGQGPGDISLVEPGVPPIESNRPGQLESAASQRTMTSAVGSTPPSAPAPAPASVPQSPRFRWQRGMLLNFPSPREIADAYPERELERGTGARVTVECRALSNRRLDCHVISDPNPHFDRQALRLLQHLEIDPAFASHIPEAAPYRVTLAFSPAG